MLVTVYSASTIQFVKLPKGSPETSLNGLHFDNSFKINTPKSARICENHGSWLPGIDIYIYLFI